MRLAGASGLEPKMRESKSRVLPLHHTPMYRLLHLITGEHPRLAVGDGEPFSALAGKSRMELVIGVEPTTH